MHYSLAKSSWGQEELDAISKVIESDIYSMHKFVAQFEQNFAEFVGSKYCVMVNSGSSANLLAVAALFFTKNPMLKRGDEVIVPAVSWSTTYTPLQQYGLKVKFVDIDLHTLNYDLEQLESAISDKTRMIMAVNLLGNPNDFDHINKIINEINPDIILLEDNCEALGAKFQQKYAGTFGLMGTFSTFFSHHMSTMEGGMIVTEDEQLYHILLSIRSHGWTRHLPTINQVTGKKSDNEFEESFKFVLPGYNVRPLEMSGAIGIEQLKKLPQFLEMRRVNALEFKKLFRDHPYLITQKEIGTSSWFGFSLVLKENAPLSREKLVQLLKENEIECRPIVTGNFVKNEVVKYFDYQIHNELKNADIIDKRGLFVGNHHVDMRPQINWLKAKLDCN
ncbi:MAG: DegT/DnrJ/EryC1/StrS family aminotransferase [Bacteriovoracaceae bacterium]|nr:DegT/DnrJ/EryC1/StrS family aminotransferase [Bacteriovoracaceae bacterium]